MMLLVDEFDQHSIAIAKPGCFHSYGLDNIFCNLAVIFSPEVMVSFDILTVGALYDCSSAIKVTLKDMDKRDPYEAKHITKSTTCGYWFSHVMYLVW